MAALAKHKETAAADAPHKENELVMGTLPVVQEAAILYSADMVPASLSILKDEIKSAKGKVNRQAWLALFDLYLLNDKRAEFDALSMLFTVQFEMSPPVWSKLVAIGDLRTSTAKERKDIYVLNHAGAKDEIVKFESFANMHGSVRLDLTKVTEMAPDKVAELTEVLIRLRKKQTPMWISGPDPFIALMRRYINEYPSVEQVPFWNMLFELFIILNKANDFENLGIEFAVATEVSPPNWEVYVNKVSVAAAAEKSAKEKAAAVKAGGVVEEVKHVGGAFQLRGVLTEESADQMAFLASFAMTRKEEVPVDMGLVTKIEYIYLSGFAAAVRSLHSPTRRILLLNVSEIVAASMEAININRHAIIVRRKTA